jgi:hypothetical protein
MTILPKIRIRTGEVPGNQVFILLPDLSKNQKTFLSADEATGQTTLSVESGTNYSANEYAIIGTPGQEHSEIKLISSSTSSTIVTGATSFAHPRGTQVTFIPFNQIVIENSTDSTFAAPTTVTVSIRADSLETFYEDINGTALDYYRVRFKHEQGTRYSSYSDSVIATGYVDNSVYAIKQRALASVGHEVGEFKWLTDEWLNRTLYEGRRDLEANLSKWSFRKKFETDIGNVVIGQNTISVPSDLREPKTANNILALYIGKNRNPLGYISKQEMNNWYRGIAHTTLASTVNDTDVTIALTNSRDLDASGAFDIAGATAIDSVDYTGNTLSTNTLTGVTGIVTGGHASGLDVWQNASFGMPTMFTVTDDGIVFNQPFHSDYLGENIYADYWNTFSAVDSDVDTLDEPDYDMFVNYLAYRIKKRKLKGKLDLKDDDYQEYLLRSSKLINKERSGQDVYFKPEVPDVSGL